jgi:hypothetical protein
VPRVLITQLPDVLDGFVACLEAELERRALAGGAPWDATSGAKVRLHPGAEFSPYLSKLEDECRCGVGWVRLVGAALGGGEEGPPRNADGELCGPTEWLVTVEMGVQRCPTLGDADTNPTPAQSRDDTRRQLSDMRAMLAAIRCCYPSDFLGNLDPGEYSPIGPEGLCLGGYWTFTFTLDDCDDCEEA